MERLKTQTVLAADLEANHDYDFDFVMPSNLLRFSFHVFPKGSGDDCAVEVFYGLGDTFAPTNPAGTGSAPCGENTVITRADAVSQVRVRVTTGADAPDDDLEVHLFGTRESA